MKLTVLGCGDAFGSEGRYNTSFLLDNGQKKILLDCGASTLIRLKKLKVAIDEISTVIISHFHGDHFGGLPFFLLSNWFEYERKTDLTIIGPRKIRERTYNLQETLYPETGPVLDSMGVQFKEYKDATWLQHEDFSVYVRKVTHSPPSDPHGLKVNWEDKKIGFSGDTEWDDALIDLAEDTDLFIIESNFYHRKSSGHLNYDTILAKRDLLKTKKLYLTHMNSEVLEQPTEIDKLHDGLEITI